MAHRLWATSQFHAHEWHHGGLMTTDHVEAGACGGYASQLDAQATDASRRFRGWPRAVASGASEAKIQVGVFKSGESHVSTLVAGAPAAAGIGLGADCRHRLYLRPGHDRGKPDPRRRRRIDQPSDYR